MIVQEPDSNLAPSTVLVVQLIDAKVAHFLYHKLSDNKLRGRSYMLK